MSKLETNTIDNISGSSTLTVGDSNTSTISIPKNITLGASGTTITVPSGATITNNGTQTGFGGANTPAFEAYLSSNTDLSNSTETKINCNTEVFDTASAYDNSSNYRFTVPSGQAGKYYIYGNVTVQTTGGVSTNRFGVGKIYKNGSVYRQQYISYENNYCVGSRKGKQEKSHAIVSFLLNVIIRKFLLFSVIINTNLSCVI